MITKSDDREAGARFVYHDFTTRSLFYQNALMLLSKAEHWKAKQMLFFKKFASLSFQLGMKIFHTTHFKSSCLPQYLIERKLESYNHEKFAPLFPP